MKAIAFGLGITILAALAAVAATSVAWIFWDAWKATDRDAFRALLGAFSGAFFAFLFVRFGDGLKKLYERKEKHHTSLVRLQHYFNDCLNTAGDNIFIADDFLNIFTEPRLVAGERPIFMNQFQPFTIDGELLIGLTNLEFTNELYSLNVDLRKLNNSMAAVDRAYGQVRDALVAEKIDTPTYIANVRLSRRRYIDIKEFLTATQHDLIKAFATSNILLTDTPFLTRLIQKLARSRYPKKFKISLDREISKVTTEIAHAAQVSQTRIDEVNARAAQPPVAADASPAAPR